MRATRFVDEAEIEVSAGDGGRGCESFRRERGWRHPRPDGGDGGLGGDVVVTVDPALQTLRDYSLPRRFRAGRGGHGGPQGRKGARGADCVLRVPPGTIVRDHETGLLIRDLTSVGDSVIVARGGAAGLGNKFHKTVRPPGRGECRTLHLLLKLIADVGIVGLPNAGKSTLISKMASVESRSAAYPFTTRRPVLGVVSRGENSFTVADLPGLIAGAHEGRGLGDRFLRHAERTKVLLHVVDVGAAEGRDPWEDYETLRRELILARSDLAAKPFLVAANKMDLPGAVERLARFQTRFAGRIVSVSAVKGTGVEAVVEGVMRLLQEAEEA